MYTNIGELSAEWQEFLALLEEQEGVLTADQVEKMKSLEGEISQIVQKLAGSITYYKTQSKACQDEIDRLSTRKIVNENKANGIEKFLLSIMERVSNKQTKTGSRQYVTPLLTITEKESDSVLIMDKDLIPEEYVNKKISYEISKALIKEHIGRGIEVPGAELKTNKTLTIR